KSSHFWQSKLAIQLGVRFVCRQMATFFTPGFGAGRRFPSRQRPRACERYRARSRAKKPLNVCTIERNHAQPRRLNHHSPIVKRHQLAGNCVTAGELQEIWPGVLQIDGALELNRLNDLRWKQQVSVERGASP